MGSKQQLLVLTMTLTLTCGTGVTGTDCPYAGCTCSSSRVDCKGLGLTTLPVLKNGSFPQTTLDISNNTISAISAGQLPRGLTSFIWTHNPVSDPTVVSTALNCVSASLTHLYLFSNILTQVPDLGNMTTLQYVDLSFNKITNSPTTTFPDSLQSIYIKMNLLTEIPVGLSTTNKLTNLGLDFNSIGDIDTFVFPSTLRVLYIRSNKLSNISSMSFSHNTSGLKYLMLSNNPLQHIAPAAFTQPTQLIYLYVTGTRLARLPLALMTLTHLLILDLSNNPDLVCTCEEAGLSPWLRNMTSLSLSGNCNGATVEYFLSNLAPSCP